MRALLITSDDIATLNKWLVGHKHGGELKKGWIPQVGYWVPGIVGCFLYQTDTKIAYIDMFIANPEVSKDEQAKAMVLVGDALCTKAKELGFEVVMGTTTFQSIADTATACNFTVSEFKYCYMIKQLTERAIVCPQ